MLVEDHRKQAMEEFIKNMKALRQELPDPFFIKDNISKFCNSPVAKKMIAEEPYTIDSILKYVSAKPEPELVVPAVLLLSCFNPQNFYNTLLTILKDAERSVVEAFEHGFWLLKMDEEKLAADLIDQAQQNPNVLLLLQRPVVKKFKTNLQKFIESKTMPLSLYAMYCYKYTLESDDIFFLEKVSDWKEVPEIVKEAKTYLQMFNASSNYD